MEITLQLNSFIMGIGFTLFAEMVSIFVVALVKYRKHRKE